MADPFVSILTPVYNGEEYLAQCIESVLAQGYGNWEYHIVNNCSTDGSLRIAESYARKNPRICVTTNRTFVSAIENHNTAFRLRSELSKYCKVVSADDWIMPDCISKMVQLAEANPTVGIVGCYQRSGNDVKWQGLPVAVSVLKGRDACRLGLVQKLHVFGTPTSLLYRADLVGKDKSFYPHLHPHADTSACYEYLQCCDFGFVHEALSVERVHAEQWSSRIGKLNPGSLAYLEILLKYGHIYLTDTEFAARKTEEFDGYYRFLGGCALKLKGKTFWGFHSMRLREMDCRLDWGRVAKGALAESLAEIQHPGIAVRKVLGALRQKWQEQ